MAWEDIEYFSDLNPNCTAKLTIKSTNGWSGDVVRYGYNVDISQRQFYFKMDGEITGTPWGTFRTYTDGACRSGVLDVADAIVGISLEHMGKYLNSTYNYEVVQFKGKDNNNDYPSWGAQENDTELRLMSDCFTCDLMTVVDENGNETEYNDVNYNNVTWLTGEILNYIECQINDYHFTVEIDTDLPIFETDADLLEYCQSGGTVTNKILNSASYDPEEEYINDQKYYKLKNLYARGSGSTWTPQLNVNYRIKPVGGKICIYHHTPTESEPYDWILYNHSGYKKYSSKGITYDDDDDFTSVSTIETHFLSKSVKFDDTSYRVNIFDTDIPRWQTKEDADDYINGLKDISECLNYDYIVRTNQEILGPEIGLADAGDDNGTNGMVYAYGARMYVMSNIQLATFFSDVFNTANIEDILEGTKLFGANQINAISGITYFPCAISEFCEVASAGATPHVGTWVCPTASSDGYVTKNNKMIDCGGDFLKPIYGDFRDLEPYQQLWVTLPFCGMHQLQLCKYLNRYISFKYSIDAVTGACSCHVYADGIELDTFDGVCSSQRCISAIDQTTYLSNVIGAVNSALPSAGSMIGGGAQAIGGAVSGDVGSVVGGSVGLLGGGASGVLGAYNVMQAVDNPPMTTRGSSSGCLGFFGCTQIHMHFFQKKTVKPIHALMLCGAPSNVSGTVSSFAGYLKCSTFKMADGFTGTNDELNEIMQLMRNGIYV